MYAVIHEHIERYDMGEGGVSVSEGEGLALEVFRGFDAAALLDHYDSIEARSAVVYDLRKRFVVVLMRKLGVDGRADEAEVEAACSKLIGCVFVCLSELELYRYADLLGYVVCDGLEDGMELCGMLVRMDAHYELVFRCCIMVSEYG